MTSQKADGTQLAAVEMAEIASACAAARCRNDFMPSSDDAESPFGNW